MGSGRGQDAGGEAPERGGARGGGLRGKPLLSTLWLRVGRGDADAWAFVLFCPGSVPSRSGYAAIYGMCVTCPGNARLLSIPVMLAFCLAPMWQLRLTNPRSLRDGCRPPVLFAVGELKLRLERSPELAEGVRCTCGL